MANPRLDELRKRLEKEPGSRLFAQLAEELRKEGEFDEAIRVCREGLQKHPAYPSARMTLGRALFDTGDLATARAEFENVVKGAPDNILASRLLGECLEGLGDLQGALARYKTTLALAPGDKQVVARMRAVEERLKAPPAAAPAPAAAAEAESLVEAEPLVEPEPPPIPLAQVDEESFELERPYEAPATAVRGAPAVAPPPPVAPVGAAPPSAEVPLEVEPEPAPIPVAAVEEGFELEQPYEPKPPPIPPAEVDEEVFELERPYEAPPTDVGGARAAAATAPALVLPAEKPAEPELSSPTLAELYFNQGFTDKAIEVYRQILEREPGNERARARLSELEALERHLKAEELRGAPTTATPASAPGPSAARREAIERTIARLEDFLGAIKRG